MLKLTQQFRNVTCPAIGVAQIIPARIIKRKNIVHYPPAHSRQYVCANAAQSPFMSSRSNCLGPERALDDVGIELDATISEEAFEDGATRGGIADRLGKLRLSGDPR
jgi:hypothetical protein